MFVRCLLLAFVLLPALLVAQGSESRTPSREVPILLRSLGYKVEGTSGDWAMEIRDGSADALVLAWVSRSRGDDVDRVAGIIISRHYYLDHYLPKEQLSAWRERVAPGLEISSCLDGTLLVSALSGAEVAAWDPCIQLFFKEVGLLEGQMLSGLRWTRSGKPRPPQAKLDESIRIAMLSNPDVAYLIREWRWQPPFVSRHGETEEVFVQGQFFGFERLSAKRSKDGREDMSIRLTAFRRLGEVPTLSWAHTSAVNHGLCEITLQFDIGDGIALCDLRRRVEDFARHLRELKVKPG